MSQMIIPRDRLDTYSNASLRTLLNAVENGISQVGVSSAMGGTPGSKSVKAMRRDARYLRAELKRRGVG